MNFVSINFESENANFANIRRNGLQMLQRSHRLILMGLLLLLSMLAIPCPAMAQRFWGGCADAAGRPVFDFADNTINDVAISSLAQNGDPIIRYNPNIVLS